MPWLLFIGVGLVLAAAKLAGGSTQKPAVVTPVPPKPLPRPKPKQLPQHRPAGQGRYRVQVVGPDNTTLVDSYEGDNFDWAMDIFEQWRKAKIRAVLWDRNISNAMPILAFTPNSGTYDPRKVS